MNAPPNDNYPIQLMTTFSSRRFLQVWSEITARRSQELIAKWDMRPEYTSIILAGGDCIIGKVAEELGLTYYPNTYYHTDAILYSEANLVPERNENQWWFRGISVAFEHENVYNKRLYEEISHLLILHSELSVVVTYPQRGEAKHLLYYHSIIQGSPRAKELDKEESFLLILGYCGPLEWKGLIYKNEGWKEIATAPSSGIAHPEG